MKKHLLTLGAIALFGTSFAQNRVAGKPITVVTNASPNQNIVERCATPKPTAEWDNWFNARVAEFEANAATQKAQGISSVVNYTIPVIVHLIHNGEAVGTGSNLSKVQIDSQIAVLNADYAGTGLNSGQCPAAFTSLKATTGITFCAAIQDQSGATLTEPGIDRINRNTAGFTAPPYASTSYIDATIKPATIWNPVKYMNVWVLALGGGLLGYATFPTGTGLTGITGSGTATTDGVVILNTAYGNTGNVGAPYHKGRTITHEAGHWLGLRHINGDGNCLTDYVADTPPQEALHGGCISSATPYHVNQCGAGTSPNGEMSMNFMDYTDDLCMYMFTNGQSTRFQTAMASGTYRSALGTHGLCSAAVPAIPVANFTNSASLCQNVASMFTDNSSNIPTSWSWSTVPAATIATPTAANTNITFPTAASYTVTHTATNSLGSNSISKTVVVTNCAVTTCDTLSNMVQTGPTSDTLQVYGPTLGGGNFGYVSGNNTYGDKAKAEYYNASTLAGTQITGAMVLFFKSGTLGTKGTGNVVCEVRAGTMAAGPSAAAALASKTSTLTQILANTAVQTVGYCGDPTLGFGSAIIIPHKFTFATPLTTPATEFFMNVVLPTTTGDTAVIFSNVLGQSAVNTAWEEWSPSGWYAFDNASSWGQSNSLAILPIVCPIVGIGSNNEVANNIAVFPNPSNGLFNFATTMPNSTDLTFSVVNALGQVVYTKVERNVTNNIIQLDLTGKAKGIYFVNITNSEKVSTMKKIIIE